MHPAYSKWKKPKTQLGVSVYRSLSVSFSVTLCLSVVLVVSKRN